MLCDAAERAELRRCLAADKPCDHLPAYRLVERYSNAGKSTRWRRECYYLVAALFSLVERRPPRKRGRAPDETDEPTGKSLTLARAVKAYEARTEKDEGNMSSVERRFLALLDSDRDQLAYRLRQMLQMVIGASEKSRGARPGRRTREAAWSPRAAAARGSRD